MARKGKNKTGPRNRDGSPKAPQIRDEDRISAGNRDKQTSSVSAVNAMKQLMDNGWELVEDENPSYKKGEQQRALSKLRSAFQIENPKISNSGDSVYMKIPGSEDLLTVPAKGMLKWKAVDNIVRIAGLKFQSDQQYEPEAKSAYTYG